MNRREQPLATFRLFYCKGKSRNGGFGWKKIGRVKGEFCPNTETVTSLKSGKELGRNWCSRERGLPRIRVLAKERTPRAQADRT